MSVWGLAPFGHARPLGVSPPFRTRPPFGIWPLSVTPGRLESRLPFEHAVRLGSGLFRSRSAVWGVPSDRPSVSDLAPFRTRATSASRPCCWAFRRACPQSQRCEMPVAALVSSSGLAPFGHAQRPLRTPAAGICGQSARHSRFSELSTAVPLSVGGLAPFGQAQSLTLHLHTCSALHNVASDGTLPHRNPLGTRKLARGS